MGNFLFTRSKLFQFSGKYKTYGNSHKMQFTKGLLEFNFNCIDSLAIFICSVVHTKVESIFDSLLCMGIRHHQSNFLGKLNRHSHCL
jgi:hypothetical protein